MRLKTLRLHGFKSFADRTTLDFRDGVTAIVGSNGCGKSNIADSIRWVLGEQRASAVRGSKMEEVIFQGTARRRPLNYAEVTLLFDNESGRVPVPQAELEISRKVFREGGSEYSLNRESCRLRDIQSLLRDTGLGANAYAVIEATMIETLLSDRADQRRALFEEAAGIGKYKDNRDAATRRLDAAEADLARLDDLIAEVESKVRSLGRQKRRAERYRELQARRLDLELALAREELTRLAVEATADAQERSRLEEQTRVAAAERSVAEATLEERRIEASELGRQRTTRAAALEAVRAKLNAREREVLVSQERRAHMEARLAQLASERTELQARLVDLESSITRYTAERARSTEALEDVRQRAELKIAENAAAKQAVGAERAATEGAAERARSLARAIATAEGERTSAEQQGRDARERRAQSEAELQRLNDELAHLSGQTELWETRADELRAAVEKARLASERAAKEVSVLREREQKARDELRQAEDRLATLTAQAEAREALERGYEGFAPAVAAILAQRSRFPGVEGPLADYVSEAGPPDRVRLIEGYLGPLLQALVVDSLATARSIRRWFQEEWAEGGSLILLPLDALATQGGTGGAWVDALLADLGAEVGDPLASHAPGVARVGSAGEIVDSRGVVKLYKGETGQGILARREALVRLRQEVASAEAERVARERTRDNLRASLAAAEIRFNEAQEGLRAAEARLRAVELDAEAQIGRRERLVQQRENLEQNLVTLEQTATAAETRLLELDQKLQGLALEIESATQDEASARVRLAELETRWDATRQEEGELRVELARAEADLREVQGRLRASEASRDNARSRLQAIDTEEAHLSRSLVELSTAREGAVEAMETLFAERDQEVGALTVLDARLAELDSDLAELGERARVARRRETEAAEARHNLELRMANAQSRAERVRERLEAEWGRPWSALVGEARSLDGDPESWKEELRTTSDQIDSLGAVNTLAVEEFAEEDRRLSFLMSQRADLVAARDNLITAIRQINRTARDVFQSTFDTVRINFHRTFQSLFPGGECDISLADPEDPLEAAVEIRAAPFGKRTQSIHLLSGGERTLTALALLFALYLVKPSPFCVMDEVDAPLDETNIGRFIQLLDDFKSETQFIVITHNPRTMEAADWVYGVTMEDPGVSSIVGVELSGVWALAEGVETAEGV